MEWDVFVSHAWEDKQRIALPLAKALINKGLAVWYDEFTLKLGDSLRRSIDQGLKNSRYGIVILSPSFFTKEWTQKELDALAGLEADGRQVILPIWHEVDASQVRRYSPMLADRIAASSSDGLEHVVEAILKAISRSATSVQAQGNDPLLRQAHLEKGKRFLKENAQEAQGRPDLELKLTPLQARVPIKNRKQSFYCLIEITPRNDVESVICPLNIVLILDRGSAMAREQRLFIKQAAQNLIKLLGPEDKIAIITFGGGSEILVQAQAVKDREWLEERVERLGNVDNTLDLAFALDEGIDQAKTFQSEDRISRIMVLTAAQFKSEQTILRIAERAGQEHIPIFAFGMGVDWNDEHLVEIAQRSGGTAEYCAQPEQLAAFFQQTVQAPTVIFVDDCKLLIRVRSGVSLQHLWRIYPNLEYLGSSSETMAGEIIENGQTFLAELTLPPLKQKGIFNIGRVGVTYDVPIKKIVGGENGIDLATMISSNSNLHPNPTVEKILKQVIEFQSSQTHHS